MKCLFKSGQSFVLSSHSYSLSNTQYDIYLTLYSGMENKKYTQLASGGSFVLDEGVWPRISCLSLWISSRWNWMIFSASSKFCCVIKPVLPAEAAPEEWQKKKATENLQHKHLRWKCYNGPWLSRGNLSESWKINICKGKSGINVAKTINFKSTSVTSCVRRALDVLVEVALTLIVVQLRSDCAQLLTQIIDLFHKNYIVLDTDGRYTQMETVNEGKWKVKHTYSLALMPRLYF